MTRERSPHHSTLPVASCQLPLPDHLGILRFRRHLFFFFFFESSNSNMDFQVDGDDEPIHRIASEVNRLHDFFVDWFCGRVENNDDLFSRMVEQSMNANFHLVSPQGRVMDRAELLPALKSAYGSRQGQTYHIDCKRIRLLQKNRSGDASSGPYTYLVSYEEWQQVGDTATARVVSAWFVDEDSALKWVHVHETWLPDMDPPSTRQMWNPDESVEE